MKLLGTVTAYAVPVFILVAVLAACVKGRNPYSYFINGAKDGIKGAVCVLPYIVAVMFATELFCSSGLAGIAGRALSAALLMEERLAHAAVDITLDLRGAHRFALRELEAELSHYGKGLAHAACRVGAGDDVGLLGIELHSGILGVH